ncbi:hypothetical protein [Gordonia jinhuaensis]|uniref:hypothetical protein n=1 Tax=Gordonia jinhuaensis TaxID=1517702 RepID=UPI001663D8B1|nr:hypothetical protein [Gordonia jinhuaensis]
MFATGALTRAFALLHRCSVVLLRSAGGLVGPHEAIEQSNVASLADSLAGRHAMPSASYQADGIA